MYLSNICQSVHVLRKNYQPVQSMLSFDRNMPEQKLLSSSANVSVYKTVKIQQVCKDNGFCD